MRVWSFLLLLLLVGCVDKTQVVVRFHADSSIAPEATHLSIIVESDGVTRISRVIPINRDLRTLAELPLAPSDAAGKRRAWTVTASLSASSINGEGGEVYTPVVTQRITGGYVDEAQNVLDIHFSVCEPVCESGRTCQRGVCVGSCYEPDHAYAIDYVASRGDDAICGECARCNESGSCVAQDGATCGACTADRCDGIECLSSRGASNVWASQRGYACAEAVFEAVRRLWCWGDEHANRLSFGPSTNRPQLATEHVFPVQVALARDAACVDFAEGGLTRYCWGFNGGRWGHPDGMEDGPVVEADTLGWDTLVGGGDHMCGRRGSAVYCWGSIESPAAGPGAVLDMPNQIPGEFVDVDAGANVSCAIRSGNGEVVCWGANTSGELGRGTPVTNGLAPECVRIDGECVTGFKMVSVGSFRVCAIDDDDVVWCWGANRNGQLGVGLGADPVSTPTRVVTDLRFSSIDVGKGVTCGISSGDVYCWGRGEYGVLGTGRILDVQTPTQVFAGAEPGVWTSISLGEEFACGVRAGQVFCWGRNVSIAPNVGGGMRHAGGLLGREFGMSQSTQPGADEMLYPTPEQVCFGPRR